MFRRIGEYLVVTMWLVSMTWMISRDVIPRWFAQEPPSAASVMWLADQGRWFQYGIFDADDSLRGNYWTTYSVQGQTISRTDYLRLQNVGVIDQLFLDSDMTFASEDVLDDVHIRIGGIPVPIDLKGERQGPQFAFQLKIGTLPIHEFVLDSQAARTLCDGIKPFSVLQNLSVGQSWKIHVVDPLSLIQNPGARVQSIVARVSGRETIEVNGRNEDCFVVETDGIRAWVNEAGRVILQRVNLPGLGILEIREQRFSEDQLHRARSHRSRHDD